MIKGSKGTVLFYVIIVLLVILIGVGIMILFKTKSTTTSTSNSPSSTPNTTASTTPTKTLSEQPNQATYNQYFSDLFLAKLPIGQKLGEAFPTQTTIFTNGVDQLCTDMTIIKAIPANSFASAIYSVQTKGYPKAKTAFPTAFQTGGSTGCESLNYAAGDYEYKIYIDNVLAAVLPFEVK